MENLQAQPLVDESGRSPLYAPRALQRAKVAAYILGLAWFSKIIMVLNNVEFTSPRIEALIDLLFILAVPWVTIIFCRLYAPKWLKIAAIIISPVLRFFTIMGSLPILDLVEMVQTDKQPHYELENARQLIPGTRACRYRLDFGALSHTRTVIRKQTEIFPGILKLQVLLSERRD